jgi:hypothetical protein
VAVGITDSNYWFYNQQMGYFRLKQQETKQPNRLTSNEKEGTLMWHLEGIKAI